MQKFLYILIILLSLGLSACSSGGSSGGGSSGGGSSNSSGCVNSNDSGCRLSSITSSDGSSISFKYNSLGQLIEGEIKSSQHLKQFITYDSLGQLEQRTTFVNGDEYLVYNYSYNIAGQLMRVEKTKPSDGNFYNSDVYDYNSLGQVEQISVYADENEDSPNALTSFHYNNSGQLVQEDRGDSFSIFYTYNSLGQVIKEDKSNSGESASHTYNSSGQLIQTKTTEVNGVVTTSSFSYEQEPCTNFYGWFDKPPIESFLMKDAYCKN